MKFLNFQTPTNFTVNILRIYDGVIPLNDANGIAKSEDPYQTAPKEEQSDLGLHCLPRHNCLKTLGSLCNSIIVCSHLSRKITIT